MRVPLCRPSISDAEVVAVEAVMRSGHLSCGPLIECFEGEIAKYLGADHAVAVSSGTAALHLLLLAAGIRPGDRVLTTPFTFVATANAVKYVGATPVFVDICPDTLCLDPSLLDEYRRDDSIAAIIPVDVFGTPADYDLIIPIARKSDWFVLEDSAEALGSSYHGTMAGSLGDAGIMAFYPNKQITTGEGGMIVTNDDDLAEKCRMLRDHGRGRADGKGTRQQHVLGYNYRMSDVAAAIGRAQLRRIHELLEKRTRITVLYNSLIAETPGLRRPVTTKGSVVSDFVYVVMVEGEEGVRKRRDQLIQYLNKEGVGCRAYFECVHLEPYYRKIGHTDGMCPVAEDASERVIALPYYTDMTDNELEHVVSVLRQGLKETC